MRAAANCKAAPLPSALLMSRTPFGPVKRAVHARAATEAEALGFKTMREGIKEAAEESVLTPRFYTTDFDEMEQVCRDTS